MRFIRLSALVTVCLAVGCGDGQGGPAETPGTGSTGGTWGASQDPDAGGRTTPDANVATAEDASTPTGGMVDMAGATDAAPGIVDSNTPMSVDGAPPPTYAGQIPIYYGP